MFYKSTVDPCRSIEAKPVSCCNNETVILQSDRYHVQPVLTSTTAYTIKLVIIP